MNRLALLLVFTAACGGAISQIEVKGKDPDLAALAGDWKGNYTGLDTGRSGQIQFTLELGRHTAEGQVFMGPAQKPLAIQFIQVQERKVTGQIAPYTDPSCNCQVDTQFIGTLEGDEIDGTFTTKVVPTGNEMHGTWKVERNATGS